MGFGLAFPLVLGRDSCWVKHFASSFGTLQNLHACVHFVLHVGLRSRPWIAQAPHASSVVYLTFCWIEFGLGLELASQKFSVGLISRTVALLHWHFISKGMPFGDKKDAWLNYKTYNLAFIGHRHSSSRIVIGFVMFPMCTLDLSRCL